MTARSTIVFLLAALAAGCGREEIKVYRISKEDATARPALPPAMPGRPAEMATAQPQLTWTTPEGWSETPPGEMRVASFKIQAPDGRQADVSVIPLPGGAGGDLANVNRWRGQVGLPPVSAGELKPLAQPVQLAGQAADLYDIAGQEAGSGNPARILAAIQRRDDVAWFFKMTGNDALVAQQKPAFVAFLGSLKFGAPVTSGLPPAHPPLEGVDLPAGHPDISALPSGGAAPTSAARPHWQPPAHWQEASPGQFLVAKFTVPGTGGAQAAVNVSVSVGDGGGLVANVNRWRGQLGLGDLSEPDVNKLVASVEIAGGKAMFADLTGTDVRSGQPTRVVGAIVPRSGQTWFYKLMGDSLLVEREREAFTKFVQSATY